MSSPTRVRNDHPHRHCEEPLGDAATQGNHAGRAAPLACRGAITLAMFAALALAAGPASTQTDAAATKPTVEHAWARATVAVVKTGAAYLTITGHGAADRLLSATTPVAERAELHMTSSEGNVMRMRPVDGLAVPATGAVTLDPGGYHLMLLGLKQPLVAGQRFPLALTFQNAGAMRVEVVVEAAGAARPMDMDHAMPGMMPGAKP